MDLSQSSELTAEPTNWRKATKSADGSGSCVLVGDLPNGGRAVRDDKDPNGPILRFRADEWDAFRDGMLKGEFD